MRILTALVATAVLGAGAVGTAVAVNSASNSQVSGGEWEHRRQGPDSARVAILLDALGRTDPVVCEMIGDQIGSFWSSGDRGGVGRFAGASTALQAAKDSMGGTITDARAIRRLVLELGASNACTRRVASKLLGQSTVSIGELTRLLGDQSALVREAAAMAAGHGDHRLDMVAPLVKALDDREPAVGAMAAWALGELDDRAAAPALVRALRGGDTRVRLASLWSLGQLEESSAVPDILTALRATDATTRAIAATVLAELESEEAIAPLERVLGSDGDVRVRTAAAEALGQIGAESSATALGRALSDADVVVRRAAAEALGALHELRVAPAGLVAALASGDRELRHLAARALCEIADPATTSALVGLVTNPDRELRRAAVEGLGEIGTPAAIQGITKALSDRDPEVRRAAVEALGEVKDG